MSSEIELLKNEGVSCSVVSAAVEKETYRDLYDKTDGIFCDINNSD